MYYITVLLPTMYHQMSLFDFYNNPNFKGFIRNARGTSTRTYEVPEISDTFKVVNIDYLINKLRIFNEQNSYLRSVERRTLYKSFKIPKKSGGLRQIDAPKEELMNALRNLKDIFENDFGALYHTNAFAYIKKRSTLDAVKRHQYNESKWFGKFDLSNFFGSTTLEFVLQMFEMIYPFCDVLSRQDGREELSKALELAFLDGGLPQGTPISPLITNIMMIPIDYKLSQKLKNFQKNTFIYTRYADDFIVSSKYDFKCNEVEKLIKDTLSSFKAPFTINSKKTRYGSSSGKNYNLGVLLNGENKITIGRSKKKQFESMLFSFAMDYINNVTWSLEDIQALDGYRNYYHMVEGEVIDAIVEHISKKVGVDIVSLIKSALRA